MQRIFMVFGCLLISGSVFAQKYIGKQKDKTGQQLPGTVNTSSSVKM